MSSAAEHIAAERRLALLQLIAEDGGQSNDGALVTAMRMIGHRAYLDQDNVRSMLRELAARDCLVVEMVRDTVMVAKITERGRMAIAGDVSVGGVASPHKGL